MSVNLTIDASVLKVLLCLTNLELIGHPCLHMNKN